MPAAPASLPAVPAVLSLQAEARGRSWRLRCVQDLFEVVALGDHVAPRVQAGLQAVLAAPGQGRWRAALDVDSHLFALAVDEAAGELALGSPRFEAEATVLHALTVAGGGVGPLDELRELVDAWRGASAAAAPLPIATVAARFGLPDLVQPSGDAARDLELLQAAVARRAAQVAPDLDAYRPSLLERLSQAGLELNARYAILRVHLLRFVAALPSLDHDREGGEVVRLLRETLRRILDDSARARDTAMTGDRQALPGLLEGLFRSAATVVRLLPVAWVAALTRRGVRMLARIFIAGEDMASAWPSLQELRDSGRDATLDQLGELVVSEAEADVYRDRVLELVRGLGEHYPGSPKNAAGIETAHVSVKVSALCSDYNPDDPDGTWLRVGPRLQAILLEAKRLGVFVNLDAEHYHVRDLTFAMLQRALAHPELRTHPAVGLVVQAYLRDAPAHLAEVLAYCRQRGVRMPLRLVKGAYWDAETTEAIAHGFAAPQFLNKAETDAMFQTLCLAMLTAHDAVQLCVGSHNLRDHCFAHEARALFHPQAPPVEHQTLHMTYEALSTALAKQGFAVRNYMPVGSLLVGMAYLVRRILENSSQVGVLTMARHGADLGLVLEPPAVTLQRLAAQGELARDDLLDADPPGELPPFRNCAPCRLYLPAHRQAFDEALAAGRLLRQLAEDPRSQALQIPRSGEDHAVHSPSEPQRVLGHVRFCSRADVGPAVERATAAFADWRRQPVGVRVALAVRAAERLRLRRLDVAALVAHEAAKARAEALADVDEAVDFLQFYAREAFRREAPHGPPSERALAGNPALEPLGPMVVISPWNFPLAIPTGMASAALVSGNTVLLKSAEQTPLVTEVLTLLLHEVGVPADAFQHLPGDGLEVGAPLVQHPAVAGCLFTGSRSVGTWIYSQLAAKVDGLQTRRAVTEMGGKNAIIVTANADLDEAVSGALYSAFGHAGQKCSAASRLLVDQRILPAFVDRFRRAVLDLQVGPAAAPGTRVNPVISEHDQQRLRAAAATCQQEATQSGGEVLVDRSGQDAPGPLPQPTTGGHYVGPCAFLLPAHAALEGTSQAQVELFGPVVHVVPVASLDEAVALFNATEYGLTGGVFAQSHDDVERLSQALESGNLYINRAITGARVDIEPFGGFHMSGTGPKAGGRQYLSALYRRAGLTPGPHLDPEAQAVLQALADVPGSPEAAPLAPVHATDVVAGLRAAATLQRRLHQLPIGLLERDALGACIAVVDTALAQLPGLADRADENRRIPGQESYNRWSLPRGPVALLAGRRRASTAAACEAVAALCAGNPVQVLALSDQAETSWQALAAQLCEADSEPAITVYRLADASDLAAALGQPHLATVLLDGDAPTWAPALPMATAIPPGQRHLRAVRCVWDDVLPADRVELLEQHLLVRSFAVHTMRHGAPLAL